MRFVSIFVFCVLAGCSWRSEQKLTYVPFPGQAQNQAVSPQTINTNTSSCPCQCAIGNQQNISYASNMSYQPSVQPIIQPTVQPVVRPVVAQQSVAQQMPSADYLLPKEDTYPTQPSTIEAPIQGSDQIVILQHPVQRDLVKCSFVDLRCISGYELQGYVQLSRTPMVPVSVEQQYDVLDGKWSDSANVPRW